MIQIQEGNADKVERLNNDRLATGWVTLLVAIDNSYELAMKAFLEKLNNDELDIANNFYRFINEKGEVINA